VVAVEEKAEEEGVAMVGVEVDTEVVVTVAEDTAVGVSCCLPQQPASNSTRRLVAHVYQIIISLSLIGLGGYGGGGGGNFGNSAW